MEFNGFSKQTLSFLGQLGRHNNRDWFEKRRSTYEDHIVTPAKAFVVAMGPRLYALSPDITAEPRIDSTIRRIYRDTRFSKDKSPYKDYLDFFFRYTGAPKEGPGYFMRIKQDAWLVGAGAASLDKNQLLAYRRAVTDPQAGPTVEKIVRRLRKAGYVIAGEHYKKLPRGYDADGLRADLLRHAALYAYRILPDTGELLSPTVLNTCMRHFKRLAALAEWLAQHV